jgi:hypothetical protein
MVAQVPEVQVWPFGHAFPQAPQLLRLFCVLTQTLLQLVWPEAQAVHTPPTQNPLAQLEPEVQGVPTPPGTQAPFTHACWLGQTVAQAPQSEGSVLVLTQ